MDNQQISISTIASLTAIIISVGTVFYHAVIVKSNVDKLIIEQKKNSDLLTNHMKSIIELESKVNFFNEKSMNYNKHITEINSEIIKSSQDVQKLLFKLIAKVEKDNE